MILIITFTVLRAGRSSPLDAGELSTRPSLGSAEGVREGVFPGKAADVFPGRGQTLTPTV